jgi:ABC-type lipoprotein export system ATPase subunit
MRVGDCGKHEMSPLLSLEGVGKSYLRGPHRVRVLKDVTLDVGAGQLVAVWGKRGVGKTTLLKIAARLEHPDQGVVRFEGLDMANMREADHTRLMLQRIGWVRRAGPKSDLRMLDYVALPRLVERGRRHAYALAREALERVGMSECAGQHWNSLSDGERSLIAIAHGIVRAPKLLLVDDPTANLDVIEREQVTQLLRSLADDEGMAVLITVPDMPGLMFAHHIASLSGGRLSTPPTGQPEPPLLQEEDDEPGKVIQLRSREQSA